MIKKIQTKLLENYPLLWNIRLVPVMLIALLASFLFFVFGYLSTHTAFDSTYYYSYLSGDGLFLLYFASVFIGILILVGWLIFYMRNNAFRIHYPRTTSQLYFEWFLCLAICVSITSIPFSLTNGCRSKWQGVTSEKEAKRALDIIGQAQLLIPWDSYYYNYNSGVDKPIPIPKNMPLNLDTINLDNYSVEYGNDGQFMINGYNGASLLFYKGNDFYYRRYNYDYDEEAKRAEKAMSKLKSWLVNEQKDSIYNLMKDYLALAQKQGVDVGLNADTWFDRVYNPPFYPVEPYTMINRNAADDYSSSYYDEYVPYLNSSRLERGYENVLNSHQDNDDIRIIMLVCLCVAFVFSILIFSCRVTSGKKWLKTFVTFGILVLLVSLLGGLMSLISYSSGGEIYFFLLFGFWLFLFVAILIYLISKIVSSASKNRSNVALNFFLWLTPCILPLCFFLYYLYNEILYDSAYYYYDRVHISDYIELMFWLNLFIILVCMIPVCVLIKKWKGLSDQ